MGRIELTPLMFLTMGQWSDIINFSKDETVKTTLNY